MTTSINLARSLTLASLFAVLSVGVIGANFASAQDVNATKAHSAKTFAGWDKKERGYLGLSLSEDQKAQLQAFNEANRPARIEHFKESRELHKALKEAINQQVPDAEIAVITQKLGELEAAKLLNHARNRMQLLSILTDEQKLELQERESKAKRKGHFQHHRGGEGKPKHFQKQREFRGEGRRDGATT